jgi:hypothetical protein
MSVIGPTAPIWPSLFRRLAGDLLARDVDASREAPFEKIVAGERVPSSCAALVSRRGRAEFGADSEKHKSGIRVVGIERDVAREFAQATWNRKCPIQTSIAGAAC